MTWVMCLKSACINSFWMNNHKRKISYFTAILIGLSICSQQDTHADAGEVFAATENSEWSTVVVMAAQVC